MTHWHFQWKINAITLTAKWSDNQCPLDFEVTLWMSTPPPVHVWDTTEVCDHNLKNNKRSNNWGRKWTQENNEGTDLWKKITVVSACTLKLTSIDFFFPTTNSIHTGYCKWENLPLPVPQRKKINAQTYLHMVEYGQT